MTERDTLINRADLAAALGLLSRLPVPVDATVAQARGAAAAWAYPLAGLLIGAITALAGVVALWLGLPPALAAGLMLAVGVVVTGGLHEDGLADAADGLWGGHDRARRLEIMRDSRIGTYGVLALGLSLILRWAALTALIGAGWLWVPALVAAVLSRTAMVAVMAGLRHARGDGLAHAVGRPGMRTAQIAGGIGALVALTLTGWWVVPLALIVTAVAFGTASIAKAKIGGQTGDILGATQQLTEIAALLTLVALAA